MQQGAAARNGACPKGFQSLVFKAREEKNSPYATARWRKMEFCAWCVKGNLINLLSIQYPLSI